MGRRWNNPNNQNGSSEQRGRWSHADTTAAAFSGSLEKALDTFAEMMIEKIESFKGDWNKPWFSETQMPWPENLSGRKYNGMNSLMLMMLCEKKGFKLPIFGTFDRVTSFNFTKDKDGNLQHAVDENGEKLPRVMVNKGEKSFPVFVTTFTVVNKETKEKIKIEDYNRMSDKEKEKYKVYPKLHVYNVFNVDQTNLKEARPEFYERLMNEHYPPRPEHTEEEMFSFPAVDKMIQDDGWICPIKTIYSDSAYYSISENAIVVPEKKQFKDGESFYSTLFHEMGHSTGAEGQLDRIKPATFGSGEYAREELVAELTAALAALRYGLAKNLKEDSVAYLKSWLKTLKEEPAFIKTVLMDVKKAEQVISSRIDAIQLKLDKGDETTIEASPMTAASVKNEEQQLDAKTESEFVSEYDEKKIGGVDIDGNGQVDADECHEEKSEFPHRKR